MLRWVPVLQQPPQRQPVLVPQLPTVVSQLMQQRVLHPLHFSWMVELFNQVPIPSHLAMLHQEVTLLLYEIIWVVN